MRRIKRRCLFILPALFTCILIFGQANTTFGVFKDWTSTETRVFGMVKLTDTIGREFDRISQVDSNTIKVEEHNPAGTLISTTVVRFLNNRKSAIEYTNQWGLLYRTVSFIPDTNHIYIVTDKQLGKNNYLPCKEAKFICKNDLLAETQFISFSGKHCNNINGIAYIKYIYYEDSDRYGRLKEMSFFDEDGLPTVSKAIDYHKVVYDRDKHGNQVSVEWYNEEGHKLQNRSGVFNVKQVYDLNDNLTGAINFGLYGEVKNNIYGVAKVENTYQNGLKMASILYDDKDNIIKAADIGSGIAVTMFEYNSGGFITSESFFSETQHPMNDQSGVHKRIYKYNTRNMLIEEEYFNKTGEPAVNKENIHRYVYGRNDGGREVSRAFYGIANQPTKNRVERVYMIKYNYYSNDLLHSESYWKDENTRMTNWGGVHKAIYDYNEYGLQTEITNYDDGGRLFVDSSGWSRLVKKYDSNARISEYSRFDGSTPAVMVHSRIRNYHSIKLTYDEKNRIAQIEYLDINEKPTIAQIDLQEGFECYKIELKYVANKLTEERFYPLNSSYPSKTIDCLKNDFVDPQGIIFGRKNRQ